MFFVPKNRPSRKGCAILRLWCVFGPVPHPLCPGGPDLLSHRLPVTATTDRQEAATPHPLVLGLQRLRLGLGNHVWSVGAKAQALRAYAQHERVHISRGTGESPEARGKGANHTGDLDEWTARHPRDTEPQSLLLNTDWLVFIKGFIVLNLIQDALDYKGRDHKSPIWSHGNKHANAALDSLKRGWICTVAGCLSLGIISCNPFSQTISLHCAWQNYLIGGKLPSEVKGCIDGSGDVWVTCLENKQTYRDYLEAEGPKPQRGLF